MVRPATSTTTDSLPYFFIFFYLGTEKDFLVFFRGGFDRSGKDKHFVGENFIQQ